MKAILKYVQISGIVTVIPNKKINIDEEVKYFGSEKKLARAKKIIGFGDRYVVDEAQTVVDLAEKAANILIDELKIIKSEIDVLILVTQSPDYLYPASSCILHGRLGLSENCATFDVGLGCSGYVYGLWLAHSLISSGGAKKVLLLAGDDASTHSCRDNRISNPLFGDAASATLLEYTHRENTAYFLLGTRGKDWDKIVAPATGRRLPVRKDIVDIETKDVNGNVWHLYDEILKGIDIFNFTMEIAPQNIKEILEFSNKKIEDIDFFAIHQANKQIVEQIIQKVNLPFKKTTSEVFSKYGNNSTNSVATVICDQLVNTKYKNILLEVFGVGLSWGSAIVDFSNVKNFGIKSFGDLIQPARQELIANWIRYFKGE